MKMKVGKELSEKLQSGEVVMKVIDTRTDPATGEEYATVEFEYYGETYWSEVLKETLMKKTIN